MTRSTAHRRPDDAGTKKPVRCAIYTRKSTEEGLQQEFNSLDAQRESAEAYIAAQKHEGWQCLPDRYDDGGFTGGNLDRPAMQRLLKDIASGGIDCVVVYKVDRLSRSLLDFSRVMEVFDKHGVSFVSVTQQFNTTHSMGRLTLNILLSFAQFEREIISERTRDKIAAARRKGKYAGGRPVLGYDVVTTSGGAKLVVNEDEAARVRAIYDLYLKHEAVLPTVRDVNARGWLNKAWVTKDGRNTGGGRFDKGLLYHLLTNPIYAGKARYKGVLYPGEHEAIIPPETWEKVQAILQRNGRSGGSLVRNKYGALLKGVLRCSACDCAMTHAYTGKGSTRYRYYVCQQAQKLGWASCPTKSVPAGEMERFVVEQIKSIGGDPRVVAETLVLARAESERLLAELNCEERSLQRDLAERNADLAKLRAAKPSAGTPLAIVETEEQVATTERRTTEVREQIAALEREMVSNQEVSEALAEFGPTWDQLSPREQARVIRLLVERVDYNGTPGGDGTISFTFRPSGIKALNHPAKEIAA